MTSDYFEALHRLRETVTEVTPERVSGSDAVFVDIREPGEFVSGVIPGSFLVPQGHLAEEIDRIAPDRSRPLVIYCATGQRSLFAADWLGRQGYTDVASMEGGIVAWRGLGLPVVAPEAAPAGARYARHLVLPEVGEEGQRRIGAARVLIVGAGGLGSPVALYLAAAGVGTLGIVDPDVVDITNLQRQILHDAGHIGARKVDSAAEALLRLNDEVTVERYPVSLSAGNALEVMSGYDVIVDGTDNFPTRYLVNDASLHLRVPVVHGAIFRWEGQATVFFPYEGPCYRCLFAEPPPPELAPNCAEAGVLGVLPGVIGSIQAVEVLKLVLGVGSTLVGRLLTYDALGQEFVTLAFGRDPACPACADESTPPPLVDYDETCAPAGRSGS
jgi:sulfur-carrier protein adenylyltransferase/sulfurtransferase